MAAPILLCYIDVSTLCYLYLSAVVGNNKYMRILALIIIVLSISFLFAYKKNRLNSMQGNQPNLLPLFLM